MYQIDCLKNLHKNAATSGKYHLQLQPTSPQGSGNKLPTWVCLLLHPKKLMEFLRKKKSIKNMNTKQRKNMIWKKKLITMIVMHKIYLSVPKTIKDSYQKMNQHN